MDREQVAGAVLWPADQALGLLVSGLERTGLLERSSGLIYRGAQQSLRTLFGTMNDLEVEGLENVPTEGGVVFASNHQSWLDVQVLGAASPRRVHFIAKSEFETWPGLRHLIRLTESVYVRRGGDEEGLREIVDLLQSGRAVVIYPEGTIPGEEDIPRTAVDPKTGLLRGHSGVARLALAAGVPIVPVGVSGTGRAFPPEVYPRLELLRLPGASKVKVRFGAPIAMDAYAERPRDHALLREITDRVMGRISEIVDHSMSYVPLELPLEPPPRADRVGVLLLHGFTSHLEAVSGLVPHLEAAGIDYEMPVLRGHMTRYEDLKGVTSRDWYADAEKALLALSERVDKVVVVGFSMGGLVALDLAARHPERLAGVVTAAAALRLADPLAPLSPLLARAVDYWPSPNPFNDPARAAASKNYPKFATDAFVSLYRYAKEMEGRLGEVRVPIRVLQSRKDQVVAPVSANLIYEGVGTPHRELHWYEESGHELLADLEAEKVYADVLDFVGRFRRAEKAKGQKAAG